MFMKDQLCCCNNCDFGDLTKWYLCGIKYTLLIKCITEWVMNMIMFTYLTVLYDNFIGLSRIIVYIMTIVPRNYANSTKGSGAIDL